MLGKAGDHRQEPKASPAGRGILSLWRHWWRFNCVSLTGVFVQLAALHVFFTWMHWGLHLATLLAVETAILHNFFWHEVWTWTDRTRGAGRKNWPLRLLRFNGSTGLVSLAGNVWITDLLVSRFSWPVLAANAAAIAVCYLANFCLSEWFAFRR